MSVCSNEADCYAEWSAADFVTDEPIKQVFRMQFSSKSALEEFRQIFNDVSPQHHDASKWNRPVPSYIGTLARKTAETHFFAFHLGRNTIWLS